MSKTLSFLGCALLLWAPGCVGYQPRPLKASADLAALSSRTLSDVVDVQRSAQPGLDTTQPFDPADGLNEAEAVAVALTLNTDLQAARTRIGESQALLISAKALPNPELGVGLLAGFNGTPGFVLDADVLFELLKSGERSARQSVAIAKIDADRAEILAKEYDIATDVRRQFLGMLVAEHQVALLNDEVALRRRAADLVRQRMAVGEGNELETSAADLEAAELLREQRLALADLEKDRLELNRLMGLPPSYIIHLTGSGAPLTIAILDDPSDAQLQDRMLAGRLDLRSKEAEYRGAEAELRLAVSRQYPSLKLGPSYEHDGVSDNYIGIGASLELPLFDQNQGGIAAAEAARERLRAEYTALLHRLTASAYAARARVRAARAEIDAQQREILPLLKHNEDLARAAVEARELNVLDWVTTQQRALRTRRTYLDSLVAYRVAILDLDAALGLSIIHPAPETPPTTDPDSRPGPGAQE